MQYQILFTPKAREMLLSINDLRIREKIVTAIEALAHQPEAQGKPLSGELAGLYSLRAAGQRYRIIYRVEQKKVIVIIVAVGLRKAKSRSDIYALAQKLLRLLKLP